MMQNRKLLNVSAQVYQWLLVLYPVRFRASFAEELRVTFKSLCQRKLEHSGVRKLIRFWVHTTLDTVTTALTEHLSEWRNDMENKLRVPFAAGVILLALSGLFALQNIVRYELGLAVPPDPYSLLYQSAGSAVGQGLVDVLIVGGPLVAIVLFLLPYTRINIQTTSSNPDTALALNISLGRVNKLVFVLGAVCVVLLGLFTLYFFAENWACIIGQAVSC